MTPKGTSVQAGFENDDKEIKRILDILSNTGALSLAGSKRQSVLYGPTDANGTPNFITATGLSISIDGSSKPIIFAFANGFSPSTGSIDLIDKVDSLVSSAWTLPPNQTCYLYVDKDKSTGLLSFGYTTSLDLYLSAAPASPVLDQHYFNTVEMKMYRYNGTTWEEKQRIFLAKTVTTTNTASISLHDYKSKVPYNLEDAVFGGVITANANIKFPVTQNPSSDSNTLDDYEEGYAQIDYCAYNGSTLTSLINRASFNMQGSYTKIGNKVEFHSRLQHDCNSDYAAYADQGVAIILPFVVGTNGNFDGTKYYLIGSFATGSSKTNTNYAYVYAKVGTNFAVLTKMSNTGTAYKVSDWNINTTGGVENYINVSYLTD
jgi:hypothetical protein